MLRLINDVPRWHVYLHREARGLPSVQRDDQPLRKLEDEIWDRLYAGESEKAAKPDSAELSEWAERIHTLCGELPAFDRLSQQCVGDADASAEGVEKLMEALAPHLQQPPDKVQPPQLRRSVASSCEKASKAIEQQRESMDGLSSVGFGSRSVPGGQGANGAGARRLSQRLRNDNRLARIALLAGRFKRIAAAKQKAKVRHGADEVTDVELGSNISRLLPSELARLSYPLLKRQFLASLAEGRALQYRLQGTDSLGRGPLVVCLDKSGSMDGTKDIWATAVALALLEIAHRQKRPFALLCFDGEVKHETKVSIGESLPEDSLFVPASGGTNITGVIFRALNIIEERDGKLKQADVVLITDGESDTSGAPVVGEKAAQLGVTVLGFGIGVSPESLKPWCDEVHAVYRLDTVDEATAEAMFTI
ncbi:MAG: VWA domain-containing protein [Myxococcaceae bacterium]